MASAYLTAFPMPESFELILGRFIKSVLRDQPQSIPLYAAEYFEGIDGRHAKVPSASHDKSLKEVALENLSEHFEVYFKGAGEAKKEEFVGFIRVFVVNYKIRLEPYPNTVEHLEAYIDAKGEGNVLNRQKYIAAAMGIFDF